MAETATLPAVDTALRDIESVKRACDSFREVFKALRSEIGKVIVGQEVIVEQTLIALFANGHILLEGVPGLGKTLLVHTLGQALTLPFSRIQFTPDLMPADITGTTVVVEDPSTRRRSFNFRAGPIFQQLVLADEINRATPKSQAAMLEAMQERSVTVDGRTRKLVQPFFVMATQNPIEQEGTYPLPEAQLDRFLFKIAVPYTNRNEMNEIMRRTTSDAQALVRQIVDGPFILKAQQLAQQLVVAPEVQDFVIRLVLATHPTSEHRDPNTAKYIRVGVSPRGAQALLSTAKVKALIDGRYAVAFRDIEDVALPALRHRIVRSFEAEADGFWPDDIITHLLGFVSRQPMTLAGSTA